MHVWITATIRATLFIATAAACLLAPVGVAAAASPPSPSFDVRNDEIFDLVYQLDCLALGPECPFQSLWQDELGLDAADRVALGRRQQIRERYQGMITFDDALDTGPLLFDAPRLLTPSKKMLLAASGASDAAEYRARLELVVTAADAAELATLVQRFFARHHRIFTASRPRHRQVEQRLRDYFAHPAIRLLVSQALRFYEVPASAAPHFVIQVIDLPRTWTGSTRGEQIEGLSTVEVKADGQFAGGGNIILHELFHAFYVSVPGDKARALVARFAADPDPAVAAAYGLINEGLATALGNLARKVYASPDVWQAYVKKNDPWYRDEAISRVAKAIFSWAEDRVRSGHSLYESDVVPAYIRLVRAAMGAGLDRPILRLRTMVAAIEDEHVRSVDANSGRVFIGRPVEAPEVRTALIAHPEQNGLVMVSGESLGRLRDWEPLLGPGTLQKLQALHKVHRAFIQTVKRGPRAVIFVMVGARDDFPALAERLRSAEVPFDLLTLES
jgi:hypothetical protein